MKKYCFFLLFFSAFLTSWGQSHKLLFKTSYGNFKVLLYDFTPNHQKLLLDAIKNKEYQQAVFNRIIEGFVVQGGEHDDSIAEREKLVPENQHQRLAPEFDPRAYHKIGALGAGRDDNEAKASFLNQLYFVVGKKVTAEELQRYEQQKNLQYSEVQKQDYLTNGGLPRLDGDYTVFGEVYEGIEVLLVLSKVSTDSKDAPLQKIVFDIEELK